MAKVLVTGIRDIDFEDKTGKRVTGLSLYYREDLSSGKDGRKAQGFTCGKQWVAAGTELYNKMIIQDYSKPFEVDFLYDIMPGNRRATLVDIVIAKG